MLRFVVDAPPLLFEQRERVCLLIRKERIRPHLIGVEYEPFAVVLEDHDDLRQLSGSGPAEGVEAEGDTLFVVNVKETDAPVYIRAHLPFF